MAGMVWRECVVLLVFLAWQVSSAEELINLLEPRVAPWAPRTDTYLPYEKYDIGIHKNYWKLIDNDTSTYEDIRRGSRILMVFVRGPGYYNLSVTKVRITLAAHARKQDVPWRWRLIRPYNFEVRRSAIKNGVFEFDFKFNEPLFQIKHQRNNAVVPIAEIELLGTRKALDALWPHGKYPCSQRLEMITPVTGELFSVAKNKVSEEALSRVFSSDVEWDATVKNREPLPAPFDYDGSKPVIIGVKFADPIPTVHEVMLHGFRWFHQQGVKRIVLQAHECQPDCSKDRSEGWVTLEEKQTVDTWRRRTFLEPFYFRTPGNYKAYRLKFYPRKFTKKERMGATVNIFFLGCKP